MKNHLIPVFSSLGDTFMQAVRLPEEPAHDTHKALPSLAMVIHQCEYTNPWFTPEFVRLSFNAWAGALKEDKIQKWLEKYSLPAGNELRVAIIMAGNLPLVGLHDLLCVLASGHRAIIKPSSHDNLLIPAVIEVIREIDASMGGRIEIAGEIVRGFDAIIATGSNNTSRYFDYYFGKYPSIIRKNRNSVAIITGNESESDLKGLAGDIFSYFGLGCRNVSKIYIPDGFDPASLFPAFRDFEHFADHNKYRNNYDYQKSIFIINKIGYLDNGFLLLREHDSLISPVSVLNFERYSDRGTLLSQITALQNSLQCIFSVDETFPGAIRPGKGQFPELWDYADGMDVMEFLTVKRK